MSRIKKMFAVLHRRGEAALVPFIMAGDPDLDATRALLLAAAEAGADLIELGVPFSDPTADGPVIQRAGLRALAHGTSLRQILELVAELRGGGFTTPIILFGYYNPIFHYGPDRLVADARRAGVDGLLVVDLPPEEADELWKPARAAGLDVIFLLAPTSDASRVRAVLRKASGFIYFVSMTGVTGSKAIDSAEVRADGARPARQLPAADRRRLRHHHAGGGRRGGVVCRRGGGRQRHRADHRDEGRVPRAGGRSRRLPARPEGRLSSDSRRLTFTTAERPPGSVARDSGVAYRTASPHAHAGPTVASTDR